MEGLAQSYGHPCRPLFGTSYTTTLIRLILMIKELQEEVKEVTIPVVTCLNCSNFQGLRRKWVVTRPSGVEI